MLYQRRIADNQIVSAKLELHLRGSRYAGVGAQLLGIDVFKSLDADGAIIWNKFLSCKDAVRMEYPDYAENLVKRIVKNVQEGNNYDNISSLEVW